MVRGDSCRIDRVGLKSDDTGYGQGLTTNKPQPLQEGCGYRLIDNDLFKKTHLNWAMEC